jgi:deoxyribodipyrimidine photo-lyase
MIIRPICFIIYGTDCRKFNMIKQAKDYDPNGDYIQRWVPEVAHLPKGALGIFMPWKLPPGALTTPPSSQLTSSPTMESSKPSSYPSPILIEPEWERHRERPGGGGTRGEQGNGRGHRQPRTSDWSIRRRQEQNNSNK